MILESKGPHDFYLALDCEDYFLREHDPEEIYEGGYAKTLNLRERDVLAVCKFNEDIENPKFSVSFPDQEKLNAEELTQAESLLRRVLGTDIELQKLYEQIGDDPLMGPMTQYYYGFKRISGANM